MKKSSNVSPERKPEAVKSHAGNIIDVRAVFFLLAIPVLLVAWRFAAALNWQPYSWIDEIFYSGPLVQFCEEGIWNNPGLQKQFEGRGAISADRVLHILNHFGLYMRLPIVSLFGNSTPVGRLLAEAGILGMAVAAFWFAARGVSQPVVALWMCALYTASTKVFAFPPGRNDVLSAAFGLFSFGLLVRMTGRQRSGITVWAASAGAFLAASLLSHQFGGIIWSCAAGALVVLEKQWRALFPLAAGFIVVMGGWALTIAGDFPVWWNHYQIMLQHKGLLERDWKIALKAAWGIIFMENKGLIVLAPLGLIAAIKSKNSRTALALLFSGLAMFLWRLAGFESYNQDYIPHFLAFLLLITATGLQHLISTREFTKTKMARAAVTFFAIISAGLPLFTARFHLIEPFALPHRERSVTIKELIRKTIPETDQDQALIDCRLFFLSGFRRATAMGMHHHLNIMDFKWIISARTKPQVVEKDDHLNNCLLPSQAEMFRENYKLIAYVEPVRATIPGWGMVRGFEISTLGCYIYKRKDSGPDSQPQVF